MTIALVQQRLVNQQIARPRFETPGELVRWMGAVQGQDYRGGLWAIGLRLPVTTEQVVEEALAARTIVRTWPMRGTLHFVPPEDVRWMLRLLTPRVIARSAGRYRELGLDRADFARSARLLSRALQGQRALTRREVYAVLKRGGVSPDGQRGIHIIGHLAQQGLICFGARRERQPTFVLLDDWVPAANEPPRAQALATLATRYFSSHGPATLQDFAWWSGLLAKDAEEGIEASGDRIVKETRNGRSYWIAATTPVGKRRAPAAVLLPAWDEYVVAYRDREAAAGHVDGRAADRLQMVGSPLIVIGGRVRGAWRRTFASGTVRVTPDFWAPVTAGDRRAVQDAVARYARFLGATPA